MTTAALKQLLFAEEMDEAIILLLTLDHPELSTPIRVCSDAVDVLSRGNTFISFNFNITLPLESGDSPPRAKLQIDNVDRQIIQTVRSISSAPNLTVEIVRSGDLDTVEVQFLDFTLNNITYNAMTVSGDLSFEDFLREPYPAAVFDPARFPGGF